MPWERKLVTTYDGGPYLQPNLTAKNVWVEDPPTTEQSQAFADILSGFFYYTVIVPIKYCCC